MTAEADASFTGGTLTADSLRTLDVTHRVALETLRMYPIAPAITRTVSPTTCREIRADILALEQETEGLLAEILSVGEQREATA